MKTKTVISEITHDDLVNLFSTALYGSTWLSATYRTEDWEFVKGQQLKETDASFEDKLAYILLNDGHIWFYDHIAEDKDEVYQGRFCENCYWDYTRNMACYEVSLDSIRQGLQSAMDGEFICYCNEDEKDWAKNVVCKMLQYDGGDYDIDDAELIMQIILFSEVVY